MSPSYPRPALDPEHFSNKKVARSQRPNSDVNSVRKSTLFAGCFFRLGPLQVSRIVSIFLARWRAWAFVSVSPDLRFAAIFPKRSNS